MENELSDSVADSLEEKKVTRPRRGYSKKKSAVPADAIDENVVKVNDQSASDALSYIYKDAVQSHQETWNISDNPSQREQGSNNKLNDYPNKLESESDNANNDYRNGQRRKNNNQRQSLNNNQHRDARSQNNNQHNRSNDNRQRFVKQIRIGQFNTGFMKNLECFESIDKLEELANTSIDFSKEELNFNEYCVKSTAQLLAELNAVNNTYDDIDDIKRTSITRVLDVWTNTVFADKCPIIVHGVLESIEGGDGLIVYASDNYRIKPQSAFVSKLFIQKYGLRRGQEIIAYLHPQTQNSTCPFVLKIKEVMGVSPDKVYNLPKFKDLLPYYPTERLFLDRKSVV